MFATVPTVYVGQYDASTQTSSILEFPANSQGSVAPSAAVMPPSGTYIQSIAVDNAGNLYVGVSLPSYEILVYADGATGAATPTRTITNLPNSPVAMAVDSIGQLYVSTQGAISVFAPNATGSATPIRQISGTSTQLGSGPIAVDTQGDVYVGIYTFSVLFHTIVSGPGYVLVFSPAAIGNSAPTRAITVDQVMGLATDAAGDILVADYNTGGLSASELLEFAPGANGNVSAAQTLTTVLDEAVFGLALDATGNIYVPSQPFSTSRQPSIQVFAPGNLSGNVPPILTFNSTAWTVPSGLSGIAIH